MAEVTKEDKLKAEVTEWSEEDEDEDDEDY